MRHASAWQLAREALQSNTPVALVTVAAVKGSAPREAGACMCVTAEQIAGTIGGGTLEHKAIASARELLEGDLHWLHQQLGLGPALGQCCGGKVELLLETLSSEDLNWLGHCLDSKANALLVSEYKPGSRRKFIGAGKEDSVSFTRPEPNCLQLQQATQPGYFHLLLFGAGHVGQALVPLLSTLPCTVHWIDSRAELLATDTAPNVQAEWLETPTLALQDAPAGSLALVMTHNHALDFEITAAALSTEHIAWVGMIGSRNKRRQLDRHLARLACANVNERLACPIGESNADLRDPSELALSFAATLLAARSRVRQIALETKNHA